MFNLKRNIYENLHRLLLMDDSAKYRDFYKLERVTIRNSQKEF